MRLPADQVNEASLAGLGAEVLGLLTSGEIDTLAERFGYALSLDRDPAYAIQSDLSDALASAGATNLLPQTQAPRVAYFKQNDTGLVAVIEARVPTNSGKPILVELVVSGSGAEMHLTLEQISAAA